MSGTGLQTQPETLIRHLLEGTSTQTGEEFFQARGRAGIGDPNTQINQFIANSWFHYESEIGTQTLPQFSAEYRDTEGASFCVMKNWWT